MIDKSLVKETWKMLFPDMTMSQLYQEILRLESGMLTIHPKQTEETKDE